VVEFIEITIELLVLLLSIALIGSGNTCEGIFESAGDLRWPVTGSTIVQYGNSIFILPFIRLYG